MRALLRHSLSHRRERQLHHLPSLLRAACCHNRDEAGPYELDGVVLRAIMIAANDFLPPALDKTPCLARPEAYQYRVIRQGDIVFVHIMEDLEHCGLQYIAVDSG